MSATIDSVHVADVLGADLDQTIIDLNGLSYTMLAGGDEDNLQKICLELIPHDPALPVLEFAITVTKPRTKETA